MSKPTTWRVETFGDLAKTREAYLGDWVSSSGVNNLNICFASLNSLFTSAVSPLIPSALSAAATLLFVF